MNEFDSWRSRYESMTYEEQVAYHNDLEKRYPEQAHFNYNQAKKVLFNNVYVLELGCWKGDLANRACNEFDINRWVGVEICDSAIRNTHCKRHEFQYVIPKTFDWWNSIQRLPDVDIADVLIATHFIEHLSNQHFEELVQWFKGVPLIYFEAPLSMEGQSWEGYVGTHKLTYGWNQVIGVMEKAGYKVKELLHQAVIFEYDK